MDELCMFTARVCMRQKMIGIVWKIPISLLA